MTNVSNLKLQPFKNRLKGSLPKIGIRPTIDSRLGGARESLENQVMNMAKSTAEFLNKNLRYTNGMNVERVIADSFIGGVAEAAMCADKFEKEGISISLKD
jgi:L-fucose isomerase